MSKRRTRVGAAAVAFGLSLAGPQALGLAAADAVDQDPGPASSNPEPAKSRADRSDTPGHSRPRAAAEATDSLQVTPTRPSAPDRPAVARPRTDTDVQPGPPITVPGIAAPQVTPPAGPAAAAATGASAAAPKPAGVKPAAATHSAAVALRPADPVAMMGAAVAQFFDSAADWMSQLPRGPVTDFLQGALLLVRRTLLGLIPAGAGQSGTGSVTASPYLSEAELNDYLVRLAYQRYGSLFGQTVPDYEYGYKWLDGAMVPLRTPADGRGDPTSDTNNQVEGVDEADFVETDGSYVYIARGGKLTIMDSGSALTAQTDLSGYVVGQFLSGDRLTVITQSGGGWYGPMVRMADGPWWDWNPQTTVTVFDVSDRTAPAVAGQTVYDGSYRDARAVDGMVYLVLDRNLALPQPLHTEVGEGYRIYETWDEYVTRVGGQMTTLSLPHAYSVDAVGDQTDLGVIAGGGDIVRPHGEDHQSLVAVVSIDSVNASAGSGFTSGVASLAASGGTTIYMTADALYLAATQDSYTDIMSSTATRIDRFAIEGGEVGWQSSGVVPGTLINQFAMDESGGYLRVATHTWSSAWAGGTWATVNDSGVYVLDTAGESLDTVGSLTGLAPGEQLYAVRFTGDTAYLVTFLRTDPLFAIDLSDPAEPTLRGELVIPGFSNYLQPVGDGLLLGIGQETEPGTWETRMHVSLFDVGDGADPTLIERQFLDPTAQWSTSDAQWDHHALLYTPEDGLLVVPLAAGGYDPQTGDYRYEQTLQVLRVTPAGIEILGRLRTDGAVLRTVRIGGVLFAVGEDLVTTYRLSDLAEIARTPLGTGRTGVPVPVPA